MTDNSNTECDYCGLLMSTCQAKKCCKNCSHEKKLVKATEPMTDNSKIAIQIANNPQYGLVEPIIAALDAKDAAHAEVINKIEAHNIKERLDIFNTAIAKITHLNELIGEAVGALKRYGKHDRSCARLLPLDSRCQCGLSEILAKLGKETESK